MVLCFFVFLGMKNHQKNIKKNIKKWLKKQNINE